MNIDRHNCEAYFLDYYEGRLSREEIDVLFGFLVQNPELKTDFEDYGAIPDSDVLLELPENQPSKISGSLKKEPADDDLIALLEGQLSAADRKDLEVILESDKDLSTLFALYKKTVIHPDLHIQFDHKHQLKKGVRIIPMLLQYGSIAALLCGAFLSVWIYQNQGPKDDLTVLNDSEALPQTKIEGTTALSVQSTDANGVSDFTDVKATGAGAERSASSSASNASVHSKETQLMGTIADRAQVATESPPASDLSSRQEFVSMSALEPIHLSELPVPKVDHEIRGSLVLSSETIKTTAELPVQKEELGEPTSESVFGTFLSDMGESMVDQFKTIAGEKVIVEKDDDQESEVITSTFKLGSFEIYRSRTKK